MKGNGPRFFTFSLGNFANTVANEVLNNRVQFFYIDALGLSAALAGTVWALYGIWNMVNDPLMGQVTDRTRSRWGRRVPYIFLGAIPLGLSFFFLFTPPHASPWVIAIYFFLILFIYDTLFTITIIAYNALFPEVARTIKERVSLSMVREVLAVIALLVAFIGAPILTESVGFIPMAGIVSVLIAVGYLLTVVHVKERPTPPDEKVPGIVESLKVVLGSRPFRFFVGFNLMKEYAFRVLSASLPFWRKYALGIQSEGKVFGISMGPGDQEAILLGLPIILIIPMLLVWQRIVPYLGYRKAWLWANATFVPGFLLVMFAHNFYVGLIGTLLVAPGLAAYQLLPLPLLSDVIEEDASRHGIRREGIFMGMNGGITKLAFTFQGLLFAWLLSMGGFVSGQAQQSQSAIWAIRFLIGGTPLIAIAISSLLLWRFPLGRQHVETRAVAGGE